MTDVATATRMGTTTILADVDSIDTRSYEMPTAVAGGLVLRIVRANVLTGKWRW